VLLPAREQDGTVARGSNGSVKPAAEAVRAQLERVLSSSGFATSERLSRFLRFIVEQALEGNQLKETLVGVEVFGRKPSYDPRLDAVVRVEAVKLRARLKEYYEGEGAQDAVRIDLPKGGYLPSFEAIPVQPPESAPAPQPGWRRNWKWLAPALAVMLLTAGYFAANGRHRRPASTESLSSVAVLPFVNLSSDKENEYFSDGLTDDLINALTKVQGLRVVARSSAFQFKGKSPDIRAVGRQLNVATVLEGSVQKSGGRLRITAQLSSVADGYHLWSETYDRQLQDVFAVQDEISHAIVRALEVRVAGALGKLVSSPTADLDAYNHYLEGRFHLNQWRLESVRKGIEDFQQAIAKDPGYAPAYAGLADCYTWLAAFGWSPAREDMPRAREAATRALQLDESLAAAHVSLGYVKAFYDWDWPGAEREFTRALQLNPGDPDGHFAYSLTWLTPRGRLDQALDEIGRALVLDPLSPYKITAAGMIYRDRRDYDRAKERFRKAIELDPAFYLAYDELRGLDCENGRFDEAAAVTQAMHAVLPSASDTGTRAYIAARHGRKAEARALAEAWNQEAQRAGKHDISCVIAEVYAAMGDKERAIQWLNKAYEERSPMLAYVKVMSCYDSLHSDPRFKALVKRIGL
jgi:TolB-like protein/Tfp pilus assembly protein PilF